MNLSILTTTYNRCELLKRLYQCLLKQIDKEFEWMIIDDGSEDETQQLVKKWIDEKNIFSIKYLSKNNGGKSRAINFGLDNLKNQDFVIIIDDDEELYEDAILKVKKYANDYFESDCVGIEFLRNNEKGMPIANYIPQNDFYMSVQERKRKNLEIDGYIGYFIERLGKNRFPEFKDEKYVGPGVLQLLASQKYKLLWPNAVLGKTQYLPNGITKQGRKLRIKNPKGMLFYCLLLQTKESGFWIRMKYSIMGYAYTNFISNLDEVKEFETVYNIHLYFFTKIFGKILSIIWKKKYLKSK